MPSPQPRPADRHVLLGLLAVSLGVITDEQLLAAMAVWVADKARPLDAVLAEQQALTPERQKLLHALVEEHLRQHGGDPQQSLASLSAVASVKQQLAKIADAEVEASLENVTVAYAPAEGAATVSLPAGAAALSVGAPTGPGERFRILRPHAKGGLGQVYVAEDQELHREVALKEIQDRHAADPESRSRFLVEAEITGALEHPGIVPVYGLGQYADGRPFYAMRLIRGGSLKEAIEAFHQADRPGRDPGERSLELRKLLGRFIDVCEAIQYAHDRGVLHRDLKPGNIMLGKYGETLVVDWGLAKPLGRAEAAAGGAPSGGLPTGESPTGEPPIRPASLSGTIESVAGAAVGTPAYMSPEQAEGHMETLGPATDVYSLGATLYCLLTGRPPVERAAKGQPQREYLAGVLGQVKRGEFPRPRAVKPEIDRPLEAICLKAMALRQGDRYAAPRGLAGDLEHWLAGEPVSAWPEPWYVRARRWLGRHRTLVTGTAAALVVGLVSLATATVLLADANETIRRANKDLSDANATILQKNAEVQAEAAEKERQRKLAVENEKLAVAAHKKSEERLDQAVETLKLFANDVRTYCEDAMVPVASKQKLFEEVLRNIEALAAADRDAEFNEDKIRARIFLYETVALTQMEVSRSAEAGPVLTKALKLADDWLAAKPGDPGALGRRAAVLHLLGEIHRRNLNDQDAVKYFTEALDIRKQLLGNAKVERFTPGKTRMDLADTLEALERWDEAIRLRREAHAAVLKHIKDHQGRDDDVVFVLDGLNWCYQKAAMKTDDYATKKAYLDQADATSAALAKLRPTGRVALERWVKNLDLHALTEYRQGDRKAAAGDAAAAKEHYAAARALLTQRAQVSKRLATSQELLTQRDRLGDALYDLARIERKFGQNQQADDHFKHCLALREELLRDYPGHPATVSFRLDRVLALAQLGRHAEAAADADIMRIKILAKTYSYGLARVYAVCATAVEAGRKGAPLTDADKALQQDYRKRSLECLEEAVGQGFDDWEALRFEPDLAAVRDEARFQKILAKEKK
jgi:serine/threonine protein kinase